MPADPAALAKLNELLAAVQGYDDPRRASNEWKQIFRLLQQAGAPAGRATGIVGMRDVAGLVALVEEFRSAAAGEPPATGPSPRPVVERRA